VTATDIKDVTGSEPLTVSYPSWIGYCGCSAAPSPSVKGTLHIPLTMELLNITDANIYSVYTF
jgi:hypothetical protein